MKRTFTFRVEENIWNKFHALASLEKRSANNLLELLVEEKVNSFEKENGEIPVDSAQ